MKSVWENGKLPNHTGVVDELGCFCEDECACEPLHWYPFLAEDEGHCGFCGAWGMLAEMYEGVQPSEDWTCLACYVEHHRSACGCQRWIMAEMAVADV